MALPPEEEKKLDEFFANLTENKTKEKKRQRTNKLTPLQEGKTLAYIPRKGKPHLCEILEEATPNQLIKWADEVWPGHSVEAKALDSDKSKRQLFDYICYLHKRLDFTLVSKTEIETMKGGTTTTDDNTSNDEK